MDFLGLRTLTVISKALANIRHSYPNASDIDEMPPSVRSCVKDGATCVDLDVDKIDFSDPNIYALMPIGDLYRSDIIELARLRNTISPVISRGAQNAYEVPDVDGLEECGTSNEERLAYVDHVLSSYVELESSVSDIVDDHAGSSRSWLICYQSCRHAHSR